jgi:hypothetical protein
MHSHAMPSEAGPRHAGVGRRLASRAEAISALLWRARHRPPRPWAAPEADPLYPGRAPEESYRDYVFRTAIWR